MHTKKFFRTNYIHKSFGTMTTFHGQNKIGQNIPIVLAIFSKIKNMN